MDKDSTTRVSVVMAACNGEKFIARQAESILGQLGGNDELVISVDPSTDATKRILLDFASEDHRVRVLEGPGKGVICNFEYALAHASGAVIFLSDQDDVWHPDKLRSCLAALENEHACAVVHDAVIVDGDLNEIQRSFFKGGFYSSIWRNVLKNRYIGCCMAFRREVLAVALPFPPRLPMHDQWLGITAKRLGHIAYVNKTLIFYRRHHGSVTGRKKAGLFLRLRWRFGIISAIIQLDKRIKP